MKSIIFILFPSLFLGLVPGLIWAGDKEEVAAATQKWADAFNAYDLDAITALYAENAAFWGTTSPSLRTTSEERRGYFTGPFKWATEQQNGLKSEFDDSVIRIYGDTAVNSGIYHFSYVKDGENNVLPARFSFTYKKQNGEWKIVDHHSSKMPE